MDETPPIGVVLLGGAHGALALARSFGRRGHPVAIVTNDHPLPKLSRYIQRRFEWAGPDGVDAAQWLVRLAQDQHLSNWLLIPGGDAEVRLIAAHRDVLKGSYHVMSCGWDALRQLCDKQLLTAAAADAGIAFPNDYRLRCERDAETQDIRFPVVLKPAMRIEQNAFTRAKAWRADTRAEFVDRYRQAAALVGKDNIVVQEFIPGGGEAQFSYAALWQDGTPVLEMTARRARQYPVEFSYTSTFVEVAANEAVRAASRRLLAPIRFEGLVEVEYKYDARDGSYKILDVNPRAWSWIALCEAAGLSLTEAMLDLAHGRTPARTAAAEGHAWIHATRDTIAALQLLARGDLPLAGYLASLRQKLVFSTFASDDPWPGILDIPVTFFRVIARRLPSLSQVPKPAKSSDAGAL